MLEAQINQQAPIHSKDSKKTSLLFIAAIFLICITAGILQNSILFSWDNSILLHETQKLLLGGTYAHDFFETSPPMILYLYIPPVLIANFFSLPLFLTFRAYIFLLVFLSLWLCRSLGEKIFLKQDVVISNAFFLALLAIMLILPFYELGQREHLFTFLSMPYLLAVTVRLENKPLNTYKAILIGFLAGLGFAIKPFFILTPILIELYVALSKKSLLVWLRPETLTIFTVLFIYTLTALILHPDYFHTIIPYATRLYYSGIGLSWYDMIFHPLPMFSYFAILFYFIQYHTFASYKIFSTVLCIALISFLLVFLLQRVTFYYHILPPLSLTLLMDMFLFCIVSLQPLNKKQSGMLALLALINIGISYFYFKIMWTWLVFNPVSFWGFFAGAFSIIFYLIHDKKNLLKLLLSIVIVIGLSYWFSYTTLLSVPAGTLIANHRFLLTILFSILLFILFARRARFNKVAVLSVTALALATFACPIYISCRIYSNTIAYKDNTAPLLSYMKTHMQHRTIYLFSSGSRFFFPLIDYAEIDSPSRFPFFWMLPGLIKKSSLAAADKFFLIRMITEDLNTKKPEFVFVDTTKHKANIPDGFEYLNYFLEDIKFQQAWKHYHYLTAIDGDSEFGTQTYHFAIYQRDFSPNNL